MRFYKEKVNLRQFIHQIKYDKLKQGRYRFERVMLNSVWIRYGLVQSEKELRANKRFLIFFNVDLALD